MSKKTNDTTEALKIPKETRNGTETAEETSNTSQTNKYPKKTVTL